MKCFICGDDAIKRHGRASMCQKHFRFWQMQRTAKADRKLVPHVYQLESLIPGDMKCPDCGVLMHWIDDDNRSSGAVLQHYRDGTLGIVCLSCNTKHGQMSGDMYRDVPQDHKLCIQCKTVKPLFNFSIRRDGKKPYPVSKCKQCSYEAQLVWRKANPDRYRELNKKHNDKRKDPNGTSI
jgi:hypothetical protein